MNLYASRRMAEIISALAEDVTGATYAKNEEALFVYRRSRQGQPAETEAIDIQPLVDAGLIQLVNLEGEIEKRYFANLAARRLDDGEAITIAIAISRNWAVATDDRQAQSILGQEMPHIQRISTSQLVKHWVDNQKPEPDLIHHVIADIEARANFMVGRRDSLYRWWHERKL